MNEIDFEALGRRIREARIKKEITQEKLAEEVDLSTQYVSNIENGRTKTSLQTLTKIAAYLETSLDYLIYDNVPYIVEQYDIDAKQILDECTPKEREFLLDTMRFLKKNMKDHNIK